MSKRDCINPCVFFVCFYKKWSVILIDIKFDCCSLLTKDLVKWSNWVTEKRQKWIRASLSWIIHDSIKKDFKWKAKGWKTKCLRWKVKGWIQMLNFLSQNCSFVVCVTKWRRKRKVLNLTPNLLTKWQFSSRFEME